MMNKKIWFDMDGTFVDLYGVTDWLPDLIACNPRPYAVAKPLVNLSQFAKIIHKLQAVGYSVGIVSWLAKNPSEDYEIVVTETKLAWLQKHLPSVEFDEIKILRYGTKKSCVGNGYLFDDEQQNRDEWQDIAFDEKNLIASLYGILRNAELLA